MKALADFILALVALIILLPIMLVAGLFIFLYDFHSPIFVQERLGLDKKPFKMIKLRSMRNGAVTFPGKIIRRTGIDEIPQLFNVLFGQMSLVGPRPLTTTDIERLGWQTAYYNSRWDLKPGIVGLAQLSPLCHKKMSWYLDRYYIHEHNLVLDFKILMGSVLIPIVGKKRMRIWLNRR